MQGRSVFPTTSSSVGVDRRPLLRHEIRIREAGARWALWAPVDAAARIAFELPNSRFEVVGRIRHRQAESAGLPAFQPLDVGVAFDTPPEASEASIVEFVEERAKRYLP